MAKEVLAPNSGNIGGQPHIDGLPHRYSILRNHHDAEDATQECFLRVLKQQNRLHEVRNTKIWLARIAWTTALDKKQASREMISLNNELSAAFRPGISLVPQCVQRVHSRGAVGR
ncbi:MAG TPA: sigma factor [Candidatus Angelobacter sp.]